MKEYQPAHKELVRNLAAFLIQRVLNAEPIRSLKNDKWKPIELVVDSAGNRFIRRSYSQEAVDYVERSGLKFAQGCGVMRDIFNTAGIDVVPSAVLEIPPYESKYPIIIASKYLNGMDTINSSKKAKIRLARCLGAILQSPSEYLPHPETFAPDMFKIVADQNGEEKPVLIDIDPYLISRWQILLTKDTKDIWYSTFISRVTQLLWNSWCKPNEKEDVMKEFLLSTASMLDECEGPRTLDALMTAHLMSQGVSTRL